MTVPGHSWHVPPLLEVRLAGGPDAPARARASLKGLSDQLGRLYDDVLLLVSELVTNAVVHAHAEAISLLVVAKDPCDIRVELISPGPQWEPPIEPRPGP